MALEALSGKQRRKKLDEIRDACRAYIQDPLLERLRQCAVVEIGPDQFRLEIDPDDPDGQTILFWYPVATQRENDYIRSAVKIEAGAKSALDPHTLATVTPYVNDDLQVHDLSVHNVTTVEAERTFWDKVVILHGLRQWYDKRRLLRQGGQRVSRHYYDVYQLMQSLAAEQWLNNRQLAADCARHARLFFGSPDLGLETAAHGSFTLSPSPAMIEALKKDYSAMAGMIFGAVPDFEAVLRQISDIERTLNKPDAGEGGELE
ncbi:MAG: nucleotidyl transferase AbiEii/AbiGii toxin family protein [Pseudomonas sp.]